MQPHAFASNMNVRLLRCVVALPCLLALGCDHDTPATDVPEASSGLGSAFEPLECRIGHRPQELLPTDAMIVVGYDMARERRHSPRVDPIEAKGPRTLLPAEIELARAAWISTAAACDLDQDFLGEAWGALDNEEEVVVVVSGHGVGERENLECITDRLRLAEVELVDSARFVPDGCGLRFDIDGITGFAPHDDLFVIGTEGGVQRARAAWNRKRRHPPERLLPQRRSKTYAWAAVDVAMFFYGDDFADLGATQTFADVRSVTAEATLGTRFGLELGAAFGDEGAAKGAEAVVQAWIDAPPPDVPPWGRELLSAVDLSRDGTALNARLAFSRKDAHEAGLLPSKVEAKQMPAFAWLLALLWL